MVFQWMTRARQVQAEDDKSNVQFCHRACRSQDFLTERTGIGHRSTKMDARPVVRSQMSFGEKSIPSFHLMGWIAGLELPPSAYRNSRRLIDIDLR